MEQLRSYNATLLCDELIILSKGFVYGCSRSFAIFSTIRTLYNVSAELPLASVAGRPIKHAVYED